MLSTTTHAHLYLRHRWLIFWSFFIPVFLLVPLVVWTHVEDRGTAPASLVAMMALAGAGAFFVISAQQELLSRSFSFLLPGVRKTLLRDHAVAATVVAVLSLAIGSLVPGVAAILHGSFALGWSLMSLMVFIYALTLLVMCLFAYGSWLPFQWVWILAVSIKPILDVTPARIEQLLSETTLITAAAAVMVFLAWQQMRSLAMHRNLIQRPYISIADLRNAERLDAYKSAISQHKAQKTEGARWLAGLFVWLNRRIAVARGAGTRSVAWVYEAVALTLASVVPRSPLKGWLVAVFFPAALAVFGYMDSRAQARNDGDMVGWFSGLIFMGAVTGVGAMAYHLRVRTMGRLVSREDLLRSGWLGAGVMLLVGVVSSVVLYGLGHLMAAVLPEVVVKGRTYFMVGPRTYLLCAPLFTLPLQLLVFCLWRKPDSVMVLQQTGTLAFFAYHAAFNMGGLAFAWLPVASVSLVLWLSWFGVWRWRVLRKDLI